MRGNRTEGILRPLLCPAEEIILQQDPKAPSVHRLARSSTRRDLL